MTRKYADWLDDVNEGHTKKKTDAEAMKIVYDNAKNHFLEWAGDNLAAKASVNAYFDDYFNAKTLKERQKIWSLIENSKYYDSLKNPQGSVNKNIKDWEAERRKSKQNKLKEEKKEYNGPYDVKSGQSVFSKRWKGFDPKTMSKSNLTDTIDQYLEDRLIEMKDLPRVPFAESPDNVKYLVLPDKERLPKNIVGDPIENIFPHQLKAFDEALLGKLRRITPSERYKVFSAQPEWEVAYRNYLNNKEILGNPTPEQQAEKLESNASKPEPTKEDKKEQSENTAKKEEAAQESIARGNNEQQQAEEAAKALTLGNFFDYTNPYFQYYTAPTALGLGLGGLLGGWKGSLLGAAGGAGLGALAKYLVDNDKIHMA